MSRAWFRITSFANGEELLHVSVTESKEFIVKSPYDSVRWVGSIGSLTDYIVCRLNQAMYPMWLKTNMYLTDSLLMEHKDAYVILQKWLSFMPNILIDEEDDA